MKIFKVNTSKNHILMSIFLFFMLLLISLGSSCKEENEEEMDKDKKGVVTVYVTALDGASLLNELPNKLPFTEEAPNPSVIDFSSANTGQTIEGFGAALTGSSAYLLNKQDEAMKAIFTEEGIAMSYVRLTVGASDFNKNGSYTYNDITAAEDTDLSEFAIEMDKINDNPVIPMAQRALELNSAITIMSSPWSPPAWMKTSKSYIGGSLLPQYYDVYANYFIKYIKAYGAEGIAIDALTVQNEPLYEPATYPGMKMSATEQADFIGNHLGPKLDSAGIDTKIIAYDHNFYVSEDPDYPVTVLSDPQAAKYVDGVAYHAYGGTAADIDKVLNKFPDANIYFTEQSGIDGNNGPVNFKGEIVWFMENVFAATLRKGAKAILLWNLALDESGGPANEGCQVCRAVVTVKADDSFVKNPEYYLLGHFSKFVKPGAKRIITDDFVGSFESVAFENTDGSGVIVLMNKSGGTDQPITVQTEQGSFNYILPANALVTLKWNL